MSELPIIDGKRVERCETCRFWNTRMEDAGYGDCRRYPPIDSEFETSLEGGSAYMGKWPATQDTDWCGEWKAKDAPPNAELQRKLDIRLIELELPTRAIHCLEWEGITTVDELVLKSSRELLEIRDFGKITLWKVQAVLAARGLHLKGDAP